MKKQRLISRLVAGSLVLLLPVLSLCGCTSNQNQVSAPTSPEQLGYTIDQQQIPQVVMEDSLFLNQETFYCPELSGDFTAVGAYWHDYLGSDAYPVAFLQAVPADTTKIKLPSGEISVSDWEQYQIFQDQDVIIYDLYRSIQREPCRNGSHRKWSAAIIRHRKNIRQAKSRQNDILMNLSTAD